MLLDILTGEDSEGKGMTFDELAKRCTAPRRVVRDILLTLREGGLVSYEIVGKYGIYTVPDGTKECTMFDLVTMMDGYVHIGEHNANAVLMANTKRNTRLSKWEEALRSNLAVLLKETVLSQLLHTEKSVENYSVDSLTLEFT